MSKSYDHDHDFDEQRTLSNGSTPVSNYNYAEIPYNHGTSIRKLMFIGLVISSLFGAGCIAVGVLMRCQALPTGLGTGYDGVNLRLNLAPSYKREIILLFLNVTLVKLSIWSTGEAHNMALKWKLAFEKDKHTGKTRLEFNANLRFFQASYDTWSSVGLVANVVMALCLTISYASSSMILLNVKQSEDHNTVVSSVALITLGSFILLQVIIAAWAVWTTHIPTWSQSPFDTAVVLINKEYLRREPGRCICSLYDKYRSGPMLLPEKQTPFWDCHEQFRSVVMYIWALFASGFYMFFIIIAMIESDTQGAHHGTSWSLIPNENTTSMNIGWNGVAPTAGVLWGFGILVGYQGCVLTSALVCTQAIAALVRDERLWRAAATEKGTDPSPGPIKVLFLSRHLLVIQIADPILHWMFGLAINVDAVSGFQVCPVQILYVTIAGTAYATYITIACRRKQNRRQPLTYGHLQTLVNLIDEWHAKMFWGHKSVDPDTGIGHAGTSNRLLPQLHHGRKYGCAHCDSC
ncbi:hypothetical protein M0805_008408 [Coniferiporia weirii]|nr:hypothetical protein M0805_008408 [Coniferiporia weirii]